VSWGEGTEGSTVVPHREQSSFTDRPSVSAVCCDAVTTAQCSGQNVGLVMSLQAVRTRVGTLIVATIYLQLLQNRYMFRSFTVFQCSHQHCVQPVASDVEVVGYL